LKLCNHAKYVDKKQKLLKRLLMMMMMMIPPSPKTLQLWSLCRSSLSLLNLANNYCKYSPTKVLKDWIRCVAQLLIISCCMLPWQVHTLQNARSKEKFSYMIFKCQIKKLCISWSSASEQKKFSAISRSWNKKEVPLFCFRLPRLIKKSFYNYHPLEMEYWIDWEILLWWELAHPHDGWIWQAGSSCNGSILRSFWLQIWSL
jgi:hypothetical protein